MSNAVFPELKGLGWNREKSPTWSTQVTKAVSGKEKRAALWSYPKWAFKLTYNILEDVAGETGTDLKSIIGFYNSRMGQADDFLFNDTTDNTVTDQVIGTGDGVTNKFTLVRNMGGWIEPIKDLQGSPAIYFDGVLQEGNYYMEDGKVVFSPPPTIGVVITASFKFYFRVRFADDSITTNAFLHNLYELKTLKLVSVK